ncbi:MAG: IS1634 family transposase [Nocardioidaceae bacterium]
MIEALVANRLTSPTPLVHVQDWARAWAVEEIFGTDPGALNDDRIGRALDATAAQLAGIVGSVGAAAIAAFGIDVARLHWDMTSISLFGDYRDPQEGFATPRFGHPKDRRTDLKQIQAGLAVTSDGGVPVFHRAYHGGAGEIAQVTAAIESLRKLAGPRKFLMVGDSKLISYPNLRALVEADVEFIAPSSKTYVKATTLAEQHLLGSTAVDYVAERDLERRRSSAVAGGSVKTPWRWPRPRAAKDRPWRCAESSSGPPPAPAPPNSPGPRSSPGPAMTSGGWNVASVAGTTPTPKPSQPGSRPSPAAAA